MKETGLRLKTAREAKGLSVQEVSLALKISSKVLMALENGDQKQLPAATFVRGFIQSYAQYVGIPKAEILQQLNAETGVEVKSKAAPEPVVIEKSTSPHVSIEEKSNTQAIWFSIIAVVLVGLIFSAKKIVERYQREMARTAMDTQIVVLDAPRWPMLEIFYTTNPLIAKPVQEFSLAMTPPAPEQHIEQAPPDEVLIEALQKVKVEFQMGDDPLQSRMMDADEIEIIKTRSKLKIKIGEKSAVRVYQNGLLVEGKNLQTQFDFE